LGVITDGEQCPQRVPWLPDDNPPAALSDHFYSSPQSLVALDAVVDDDGAGAEQAAMRGE